MILALFELKIRWHCCNLSRGTLAFPKHEASYFPVGQESTSAAVWCMRNMIGMTYMLCLAGPWSSLDWKAVCGVCLALPSVFESYCLNSKASSGRSPEA